MVLSKPRRVVVNDSFQQEYIYYCTEPIGRNFHEDFKPDLTPKQMLELGVFGGNYFGGERDEFPSSWWGNAKIAEQKDSSLNFFTVSASKPLSYWQEKGWIHPQDPRGWFQWYCRYYLGRRSDDDIRQIKRWKAMRRHISQLQKNCPKRAWDCRPRQRQALLHWAYDSREL